MITIECAGQDLIWIHAVGAAGVYTREINDTFAKIEVGYESGPKPLGLVVRAGYDPSIEGWTVAVGAIRAGLPLPWPTRVVQGRTPGSVQAEIDCPAETPTRLCPRLPRVT